MSDFDPKDIHKDITSDFAPEDIHSPEQAAENSYNIPETAAMKLLHGASVGTAPIAAGSVAALGRALGIQGVGGKFSDYSLETPTLDPEELLKAYRNARDIQTGGLAKMQQEHPTTSNWAETAGGFAAAPFLPAAEAAQGAGLAGQMLAGAKTGATYGALTGGATSQANNPLESSLDVLKGTAGGAALGGAIPAVTTGLGMVPGLAKEGLKAAGRGAISAAEPILPETPIEIYKKALNEGIDVTSPEFYNRTSEATNQVAKEISEPIAKKVAAQQEANAQEINSLDEQLANVKKDTDSAVARGQERANIQNADDISQLEQNQVQAAKDVQERVSKVRGILGNRYDKYDAAAEKAGITPQNNEVISNLEQNLITNGAAPQQVQSVMKKFTPYFGDNSVTSYRQVKSLLRDLFTQGPELSRAARQAYGELNDNYFTALNDAGYAKLADLYKQNNVRWKAALDLENNFMSNVKSNVESASTDTLGSILKMTPNTGAKNLTQSQQLAQQLKTLDPAQAQQYLQRMQNVAVPKPQAEAVNVLPNPELGRLQGLLNQAKAQNPQQIPGLEGINTSSPEALQQQVTGLLPKAGTQSGNISSENKLNQIFDVLKKEMNPETAQVLRDKAEKVAQDLKLRSAIHGGTDESMPGTLAGAAVKGVGGIPKIAAKLGEALRPQEVLTNGAKSLTNASPEEISQMSMKLKKMGADGYARVLDKIGNANEVSRNALIFGLMQQPDFRKLINNSHDDNTGK